MFLTNLINKDIRLSKSIEDNPIITGLDFDSRKIKKGMMYAAINGENNNGIDFCDKALKAGATTILCSKKDLNKIIKKKANILTTKNVRLSVSLIIKKMFPKQPKNIVAITGTNGKTSIAFYLKSIWKAADISSATIGTLGIIYANKKIPINLTTPDPITLHKYIDDLKTKGVKNIALEASSHGIDQNRIDALSINRAVFCNFSRDHLDYHKTLENYFKTKKRLFSEILEIQGIAIVNNDCKHGKKIENFCKRKKIKVFTYGANKSDWQINKVEFKNSYSQVWITILGKQYHFKSKLFAYYQIENLVCSMLIAHSYNISLKKILKWVEKIKEPPGRLEKITIRKKNIQVYIDYAHTPEALKINLTQLRESFKSKGSLKVLFGCGGDRDIGKRKLMAIHASNLADVVYITDDNPRYENPKKIRDQISLYCKNSIVIPDRKLAIKKAIKKLENNDILLVAGKGHEKYQEISGKKYFFDDKEVVLKTIKELKV